MKMEKCKSDWASAPATQLKLFILHEYVASQLMFYLLLNRNECALHMHSYTYKKIKILNNHNNNCTTLWIAKMAHTKIHRETIWTDWVDGKRQKDLSNYVWNKQVFVFVLYCERVYYNNY